ncbi:NAD(P)-dependent oxidoreductase [Flocculibacter collagenilyticus]|uniref:NAD(P)-dependent oxidoreductase n=1 Tax=Flocculibacter collagenilyticus TaxID=2744479 RepID=UPI0038993011
MKVAFIGLGVMGYPMAGHLQQNGRDVCVYNRTTEKAKKWVEQYNGTMAETPKAASLNADIVFACVGNDHDMRAVTLGDTGIYAGLKNGGLLVDHTTTSAQLAKELAQQAQNQNKRFMDAPVSGGQAGAENGALTIMCGANEIDFAEAEPIMAAYAKFTKRIGDIGSGQLAKMVNQICIAGVVQGLSEGLHFAQNAGLDAEAVIETIEKGAAGSWQMENRHKTMLAGEYDHGFAVDWMRKDLGFALNEARENKSHLPVTALVDQFYSEVQAMGGHRWDTSSLLARLESKK